MYATLHNNQLITPAHDGAQFVVDIDGPGVYEVKTCYKRGDVVEFGTGLVEVAKEDFGIADILGDWGLPVENHKVVILTAAPTAIEQPGESANAHGPDKSSRVTLTR